MLEHEKRVFDRAGKSGRIVEEGKTLQILLDTGEIVSIDERLLLRHSDGVRTLPGRWTELATSISIPRVEEQIHVGKRRVLRQNVVLTKAVQEVELTLGDPLFEEEVTVERVPVQRFVDTPPKVRTLGETLIIPCIEEVVVYEKRLRVREELHVRRVRQHSRPPVTVTARREQVVIDRRPADGQDTTVEGQKEVES